MTGDKYLIYKINQNKSFVFKTSKLKMQSARVMQSEVQTTLLESSVSSTATIKELSRLLR